MDSLPPVIGNPGDVLPPNPTRLRWSQSAAWGFDPDLVFTLRWPSDYQDVLRYDVPETLLGHPHTAGFVVMLSHDLRTVRQSMAMYKESSLRSGNRAYDNRRGRR